jgi:hypothetical protein
MFSHMFCLQFLDEVCFLTAAEVNSNSCQGEEADASYNLFAVHCSLLKYQIIYHQVKSKKSKVKSLPVGRQVKIATPKQGEVNGEQ